MKKILAIALALVSVITLADWKAPDGYRKMTHAKRVCVKRDTETLKGYVITYWQRDGKPDWILPPVETNALKHLKGKEQYNPLQNDAETLREISKTAAKAAKKDLKTFQNACKDIEKARDKTSDADFKAMYQKTLDIWTAQVNGEVGK